VSDKITLQSVSSVDNTLIAAINNNNAVITTAFDNTLSRNGQSPNQMTNTLDMNGQSIINLPFATSATMPVVAGQLAGPLPNFIPALTGDVTGSVSGNSIPTTLATVNSNVGSFGSANSIPVVTANAKGLTTAVSTVQPNPTQVNGVSFPASPSTNTIPVVTGSNTITYEAVPGSAIASNTIAFSNLNSAAIATTSQYLNDTSSLLLQSDQVWGAAGWVTVTFSATTTLDFSTFINMKETLTSNVTFANPSNVKAGQVGIMQIIQGTGGQTASWGTNFHFPGGSAPTLSTGSAAIDLLGYVALSSTYITVFMLAKGT
jgi:hypothetical protein